MRNHEYDRDIFSEAASNSSVSVREHMEDQNTSQEIRMLEEGNGQEERAGGGQEREARLTNREDDVLEKCPNTTISILHANMNGFATHSIDILAEIELLKEKPMIIALNETKLKKPPPGQKQDNLKIRRLYADMQEGSGM